MRRFSGRTYLFQKRVWTLIAGIIDFIGYLFRRPADNRPPDNIKKILVSRIDHLGDVFIATSILPALKKAFPYAQIHFLAGRWSVELLQTNPYVEKLLIYNSFVHNRTGWVLRRFIEDIKSFLKVLNEIKRENYDIGIDLRAYPFNSILLMYIGKVRYKIGFATGGWGFLLDRIVDYRTGVHETEHLRDILLTMGIEIDNIRPSFSISRDILNRADIVLQDVGLNPSDRFILIHSGSGNPKKQWPMDRWQRLIDNIKGLYSLKILVYDDAGILTNCHKLPDNLNLDTFAGIVKKAMLFIGLDSFPAHLAASNGIPTIVIWSGISDYIQWQPVGKRVYLLRREIECSPCYRGKGCYKMECMDITVQEVLAKLKEVFDSECEKGIVY